MGFDAEFPSFGLGLLPQRHDTAFASHISSCRVRGNDGNFQDEKKKHRVLPRGQNEILRQDIGDVAPRNTCGEISHQPTGERG